MTPETAIIIVIVSLGLLSAIGYDTYRLWKEDNDGWFDEDTFDPHTHN